MSNLRWDCTTATSAAHLLARAAEEFSSHGVKRTAISSAIGAWFGEGFSDAANDSVLKVRK